MEELILSGNLLRNEGVKMVLRGVSIAKALKKIYLADNQFYDSDDMIESIKWCMAKNENLGRYDFSHNNITNHGK